MQQDVAATAPPQAGMAKSTPPLILPRPPTDTSAPVTRWLAERNGNFTLALSAGFFGMYAHAGVLAALEAAELRPGRIVGVSSGALAGAFTAAGRPASELYDALMALRLDDFLDRRWKFGLAKGERLAATIEAALPAAGEGQLRIEDLPTPFATVAFDITTWRTRVLETGSVGQAVRASCAFPMLFEPVTIDGHKYTDGAVSDPLGWSALNDREDVLMHVLPPRSAFSPVTKRMVPPLPDTDKRKTLRIEEIGAVTPGRLDQGARAFAQGRDGAKRWLAL